MVYFVLVLRGFLLSENFQYLYVRLFKIEDFLKQLFTPARILLQRLECYSKNRRATSVFDLNPLNSRNLDCSLIKPPECKEF